MTLYRMKFEGDVDLVPNGQGIATVPPVAQAPTVPCLDQWKEQMLVYARRYAAMITNPTETFDMKLFACLNYDGWSVFQQVKDYTKSNEFDAAIAAFRSVYRDQYLAKNNYGVPAHFNYTDGLVCDAITGDLTSKNAMIQTATLAPYARDQTDPASMIPTELSRETAYVINCYLNAEKLGQTRRSRLSLLIDNALGHIDQWFRTKKAPYVRPFMVALTCNALIRCADLNIKPSLDSAVQMAADELWKLYVYDRKAFPYTDRVVSDPENDTKSAPDLNLLIAPVYAWIYAKTKSETAKQRVDELFEGGVKQADLLNVKRFNQNYLHSFRVLKWCGVQ